MTEQKKLLNFPFQIMPEGSNISDFQLICEVRLKLTNKLNKVAKGEYKLTEEDKADILAANDVFSRNGYPLIDVDLSQH